MAAYTLAPYVVQGGLGLLSGILAGVCVCVVCVGTGVWCSLMVQQLL